MEEKITIDIVSDVACPWCYVGKRKLEAAIKEWKGAPVEINWHPFQLDPTMPKEGMDGATYLKNKFGNSDRMNEITGRLTEVGKQVGIPFDFEGKWYAINTLYMHQLMHVAGQEGFKNELKERFLKAYFEEKRALNEPEVLCEIMAEYNWSAEKVNKIISDESIAEAVKTEINHYQQMGVSGVPFFIINNKYGISGAQESATFLKAFNTVSPLEIIAEGDSCDPLTGAC